MVKAGVIDPAKVTKTALINAASIAGLMLTTEAMVAEIKEKDKGGMPGGGGGMGGRFGAGSGVSARLTGRYRCGTKVRVPRDRLTLVLRPRSEDRWHVRPIATSNSSAVSAASPSDRSRS